MIPATSRELLLKTLGQGGETQTQRTAFDQSARAASNTPATPGFSDTMDDAIANLKSAYSSLAKEKQKLMTENTKLALRKELMSNSAIQDLIKMRGDLTRQVQNAPTKIEGRADINPLVQGRVQGGDIASLVGAMSDVSGDIETRGTGVKSVIDAITSQQKQDLEGAKTEFDAAKSVLGSMIDVSGERRQQALLPGQLEAQQWDIETKKQKATGTEPLTIDQILKAQEQGEGGIAALEYYQNRGNNTGIVPILGGKPADTITNAFGAETKFYKSHGGIDFRAQSPLPVGMPMDLTVVSKGSSPEGGIDITLKDSDGYTYTFRHLQETSPYQVGQVVPAGQQFAVSGNTGKYTTGAHLHMEMRSASGKLVDPTKTTPPSMSALNKLLVSGGKQFSNSEILSYSKALGVAPTQEAVNEALSKGQKPQTAAQLEKGQAITQSKNIVDQIDNLSKLVNTESKFTDQIKKYSYQWAQGTNENIAKLGAYQASLTSIARSLGEKGVISDGDIARFGKSMPNWRDTSTAAKAKLDAIRTILNTAANTAPGTYENAYTTGDQAAQDDIEAQQFIE